MKVRLDPKIVAANVARREFVVKLHLWVYLAIHCDSDSRASALNLHLTNDALAATAEMCGGAPKLDERNDMQQNRQRHQKRWNQYQRKHRNELIGTIEGKHLEGRR